MFWTKTKENNVYEWYDLVLLAKHSNDNEYKKKAIPSEIYPQWIDNEIAFKLNSGDTFRIGDGRLYEYINKRLVFKGGIKGIVEVHANILEEIDPKL